MIPSHDQLDESRHPISLCPARLDDFAALVSLFAALHHYNASFDAKFTLASGWKEILYEHFLQTYSDEGAYWLLAWQDTKPVGLLVMESHTDSPLFQYRHWVELVALYVDPSCRSMGLGHRLMERASAWAAARGSDRVQLYVTAQNESARAFYRKTGWHPVQEIWRLDVQPFWKERLPLADPSQMRDLSDNGCHSDILSGGHHQFAMEVDSPREGGAQEGTSSGYRHSEKREGEHDAD